MNRQQRQIDEMLSSEGWQVVDRQRNPSWWLAEVWVLESISAPVGSRAYLSFLVDSQSLTLRDTGDQAWALSLSLEGPAITPMGVDVVPLRQNWEKLGREKFLEKVRALRVAGDGRE
jgi:hypothetical protein